MAHACPRRACRAQSWTPLLVAQASVGALTACGSSDCTQFEDDDDTVDLPAGHLLDAEEVEVCDADAVASMHSGDYCMRNTRACQSHAHCALCRLASPIQSTLAPAPGGRSRALTTQYKLDQLEKQRELQAQKRKQKMDGGSQRVQVACLCHLRRAFSDAG